MTATVEYVEVWSDYPAAGGARETFLPMPSAASDDRGVDGQDTATIAYPKGLAKRAALARGKVLRFRGSETAEWEIRQIEVQSGSGDPLITVALVPPADRLRKVPVRLVDGDGYVYHDVPMVGVTPAAAAAALLADAPSWFTLDTVTPTDRVDLQFSGDSSLSALHALAQVTGMEIDYERNGTTDYKVKLVRRGASATPVRIRTTKNLANLRRVIGGEQVTRALRISGADSDGGRATIGWARWHVTAAAGNDVTLGPIHGSGPGPVGFDDQYNHAALGYTAYLERADGTRTAITDSVASTQVVTVADGSGITVGDRVRIVASSAGEHLAQLDAPAALAADGLHTGDYTSEWDDTENLVDNGILLDYSNPSGRPDGASGSVGTWTRESDPEFRITGDYSAKCVMTAVGGGSPALIMPATFRPSARRHTISGTGWIRVTALSNGQIGVRLMVGGQPVGEMLTYRSPINTWWQPQLSGLDIVQHIGTTQSLGIAIYPMPDATVMNGTFYVDSMQISPSATARAITTGSNPARIVQQVNAWLYEKQATPIVYTIGSRDLARAGLNPHEPYVLGGPIRLDDEELGVVSATARLVRSRRDLIRGLLTEIQATTAPAPLPGRLASPKPLTIPFFEPIEVRAPSRDTRQARQTLSSKITATGKDTVTITLYHSDLLGGTPTIVNEGLSGATYASGSGLGPYVFNRPAAGSGPGGAHFTAKIQGRTDVATSVEVPAQDIEVGSITGTVISINGGVNARLEGSASTASWRYAVSTSAMPSDGTVDSATPVNGRSVDLTGIATLALNQTVHIKARAYSGASGGGQPAAGYITTSLRRDTTQASKTVRYHATDWIPMNSLMGYRTFIGAGDLGGGIPLADTYVVTPLGAPATAVGYMPLKFAPGTVLTQVRANLIRSVSGATAIARLKRLNGSSLSATLATLTQSSGGAGFVAASINETVGSQAYILEIQLSTSTIDTDAAFVEAEVTYTAPTYEVSR